MNTNKKLNKDTGEYSDVIERIVQKSRLNELKEVVNEILEDNAVIIKGLFDQNKNAKRGSKFRGVSKNGKKWQVILLQGNLLLIGDGNGQHDEVLLRLNNK